MSKQKKFANLIANDFIRVRDIQKKKIEKKKLVLLSKNDFDFLFLSN